MVCVYRFFLIGFLAVSTFALERQFFEYGRKAGDQITQQDHKELQIDEKGPAITYGRKGRKDITKVHVSVGVYLL